MSKSHLISQKSEVRRQDSRKAAEPQANWTAKFILTLIIAWAAIMVALKLKQIWVGTEDTEATEEILQTGLTGLTGLPIDNRHYSIFHLNGLPSDAFAVQSFLLGSGGRDGNLALPVLALSSDACSPSSGCDGPTSGRRIYGGRPASMFSSTSSGAAGRLTGRRLFDDPSGIQPEFVSLFSPLQTNGARPSAARRFDDFRTRPGELYIGYLRFENVGRVAA